MKLSDKIIKLRKLNGWSQEELAEKINVSRQAISRWEGALAQPDATNILQLSKLFGVTTDYLLNDEYESDDDLPKISEVKKENLNQILVFMVTIEVMILILQFIATIILQSDFFGVLSFIPFVAAIGGFEYACRKRANETNETARRFRKKFYKISVWLGAYFPIRFIMMKLATFYPRPYNSLVFDCVTVAVYLIAAILITLLIEKSDINGK